MSVEKASAVQPTRHGVHVAIEHVTGAMGQWMLVSQNKAVRFGA
jgi:predicted metal-dependent hydrolase